MRAGRTRSPAPTPTPSDADTAALRGLATDDATPATLRQAARDALAPAPGEPVEPEHSDDTAPADAADDRTCPECGAQFGPDATFCAACGTPLE